MTTLAELGLKEIVRDTPADFGARLYVTNGPLLAYVIRREPPVSKESETNVCFFDRTLRPELTDEQYERARHWFDCLCKATEAHFALAGKRPLALTSAWTVFK